MDLDSLPEDFLRAAVRRIHHNTKDEKDLAHSLAKHLLNKFFAQERVVITSKNGDRAGVITSVVRGESPSNKENERRYSVQTDQGQEEVVDASMLRRDTDITEADFQKLIAKCAARKAPGLPWTVNDDLRQKYGVKDKVHPLFLMSKSPATPKTPTSSTARTLSASSSRTSEPSAKRSKLTSSSESASVNGKATSSKTVGNDPSTANSSRQDRDASMSSIGSFPEVEVVLERMSTGIAPSSYGAKMAGQLKKRSSSGRAGDAESSKVKKKKESAKSKGTPKEKKTPKVGAEKEKKTTKKGDAKPYAEGKKEKKKAALASATPTKTTPKKNTEKVEAGDKGKKKKQKDLSQFFSPSTSSTPSGSQPLTQEERQAKRLNSVVERILRNLRNFDHEALDTSVTLAVKSLTVETLSTMNDAFVKYIIQKKAVKTRNQEKMKRMSVEERKKVRAEGGLEKVEPDPYYESILSMLASGKREDTLLNGKRLRFPQVDTGPASMSFFARCLHLTEFFNSFRPVLSYTDSFSANELIKALHDGWNGFFSVTGPMLRVLVVHLVNDGHKRSIKAPVLNCRLYQFSTEVDAVSELAKLLLLERMSSHDDVLPAEDVGHKDKEQNTEEEDDDDFSRDVSFSAKLHGQDLVDAVEHFKHVDFYELTPEDQLALLEHFVDKVRMREPCRAYLDEGSAAIALQTEKKQLETKLAGLNTKIAALPTHEPTEEELLELSRKQSKDLSSAWQERNRLVEKVERLKEGISKKDLEIKEAKLTSRARVVPLGYDRNHRRYWFFPYSANTGVYIEQGYLPEGATMLPEDEEVSKDSQDAETPEEFLQRLQSNLEGRPPKSVGPLLWWHIGSVEELDAFMERLFRKGVREEALRVRIEQSRDFIVKSFSFTGTAKKEEEVPTPETPLDALKRALLILEGELRESLFSKIKDPEAYRRDVEGANNLDEMKELVLALFEPLPAQCIRKSLAGEWQFKMEQWLVVLHGAATASQVCMLLDIAEQYIDWTNALSKKKCRACRNTGSPDWPIAVCVSCGTPYHLDCCKPAIDEEEKDNWKCKICVQEERRQQRESEEKQEKVDDDAEASGGSDEEESMYSSNEDDDSDFFTGPTLRKSSRLRRAQPSIKQSLRSPPINPKLLSKTITSDLQKLQNRFHQLETSGRVYQTLRSAESYHHGTTLTTIKNNLKKYKSVAALDEALKQNVEDACVYYDDNERKLTQLAEFKSTFFED